MNYSQEILCHKKLCSYQGKFELEKLYQNDESKQGNYI